MAFSSAISNGAAFGRFLGKAAKRRVAVACINDSTGGQISEANVGFIRHIQNAFERTVGIWGSTVYPPRAVPEWVSASTPRCSGQGTQALTSAPSEFVARSFIDGTNGVPRGQAWWPANSWKRNTTGEFTGVFQNHPIDKYRSLAFCSRLYKDAAGDITIYPNIGAGGASPITGQSRSAQVVSFAGQGSKTYRHQFPAGSVVDMADPSDATTHYGGAYVVTYREQFYDGTADNTFQTGDFGVLYRWAEDYAMFRGVQVNILYQHSSQGSYNVANDLCNAATDKSIDEWLDTIASAQIDSAGNPLPPVLCLMCGMGANDAGQTGAAIQYTIGAGQGGGAGTGSASNTATGYRQNSQSWINRVRERWLARGYSDSNLSVVLYTPVTDTATSAGARYAFYQSLEAAAQTMIADSVNSGMGGITYCHGLGLLFDKEIKQQANVQSTAAPASAAAVYGWRSPPSTDVTHMNDWAYESYVGRMFSALIDSAGGWSRISGGNNKPIFIPVGG